MSSKWVVLFFLLVIGGYEFNHMGCTIWHARPSASSLDHTPLVNHIDPIQKELMPEDNIQTINKVIDHKPVLISPVASYKIAGQVVSKRHYDNNFYAKLSPVDLALAWGPITTSKYFSEIDFYHSYRYYNFSYKSNVPLNLDDISRNSSNTHLIPANKKIDLVLKSIGLQEVIELEGYLVNVDAGSPKDGYFSLTSSLTREDKGEGACEVMYVTKVRIGTDVFR